MVSKQFAQMVAASVVSGLLVWYITERMKGATQ